MLYFNKLTKIINAEINEIKNDPILFICRVLLNFIISIFVGFLFILLFVYSLYTLINPFVLIIFSVIEAVQQSKITDKRRTNMALNQ